MFVNVCVHVWNLQNLCRSACSGSCCLNIQTLYPCLKKSESLPYNRYCIFWCCLFLLAFLYTFAEHPVSQHSMCEERKKRKLSNKFVYNSVFLDLWAHAYFVSSESGVLRLIPCCSYYWPLLRHYAVNDCLSAIRSINWIQRNVIHYSLQPSRCWGFCKSNSFIMLIPLFCHMHHFHLSGVEKSSDGFGSLNKRCLTFNEMRNMKNTFQWQVAYDNHNKKALWMNRRSQYNCGTMLCFLRLPFINFALITLFRNVQDTKDRDILFATIAVFSSLAQNH